MGSRVLDISVDGAPFAANIDIFKDVGLNAAAGTSGKVVASGDRLTVMITASVRSSLSSADPMPRLDAVEALHKALRPASMCSPPPAHWALAIRQPPPCCRLACQ